MAYLFDSLLDVPPLAVREFTGDDAAALLSRYFGV